MATETNGIATEYEVSLKTGNATLIIPDRCCTKEKALNLDASRDVLSRYSKNQLVKYSDITKNIKVEYYDYFFTYTFFYKDSRKCSPSPVLNSEGYPIETVYRIFSGVTIPGSGSYIPFDSDLADQQGPYILLYKYKNDSDIQAISIYGAPSDFTYQYTPHSINRLVTKVTTTNATLESIYIDYSGLGFDIDGDVMSSDNYATYIMQFDGFNYNVIKKIQNRGDSIVSLKPNGTSQSPYHIWVFEDQYLANLLLGSDSNSYE